MPRIRELQHTIKASEAECGAAAPPWHADGSHRRTHLMPWGGIAGPAVVPARRGAAPVALRKRGKTVTPPRQSGVVEVSDDPDMCQVCPRARLIRSALCATHVARKLRPQRFWFVAKSQLEWLARIDPAP